jgi:hypothetical protein
VEGANGNFGRGVGRAKSSLLSQNWPTKRRWADGEGGGENGVGCHVIAVFALKMNEYGGEG